MALGGGCRSKSGRSEYLAGMGPSMTRRHGGVSQRFAKLQARMDRRPNLEIIARFAAADPTESGPRRRIAWADAGRGLFRAPSISAL